jgi:lipoprotein-releasing system ATP-binding protein
LLPEFTAVENIMLPALIHGASKADACKRAMDLLGFLSLADKADKKPDTMSGGENQRVAVARALINRPQIVLADEPSGNLDSKNAMELQQLFLRLREEFGQAFVIVTHNEQLANIADRKLTMRDGKVIRD